MSFLIEVGASAGALAVPSALMVALEPATVPVGVESSRLEPPEEDEEVDVSVEAFVATVFSLRCSLTVSLPSRCCRNFFSKALTFLAVPEPYCPSAVVRNPARVRYFCAILTSDPVDPLRRVRVPYRVAPSADAASRPITTTAITPPRAIVLTKRLLLFLGPTGLADGLAPKEQRYVLIGRFAPGPA